MESFLFSVNAVSPIIIMVIIGYILKKIGLMTADFAKKANALVFRCFLPAMLFLNVYKIESFSGISGGYIVYAVAMLVGVFLIAIPLVMLVTKSAPTRGALLQGTFRSNNALIGLPLAQSLFGAEGVIAASLLSAVIIPMFNILAVISLSIFHRAGEKVSIRKIVLGIVKNPLIQSILFGLFVLFVRSLFVRFGISFRISQLTPIYKTLESLSAVATPLALLVLGAQFEFSAVASLKKEIIFGVAARTVVVPLLVLTGAYLFFPSFTGAHYATFLAAFATPVAVSSMPMAQEMGADSTLAGQLIVWATIASAFTLFGFSFLLKSLGIF
jgi:predicted permease